MPLPQLVAVSPQVIPAKEEETVVTVIPASDEKVYDKYWMTHLIIAAPSTTSDARLIATLVPVRDVEVDGVVTKELMPDADQTVININNVFGRASVNESFAMALVTVLNELIEIGKEKGVLV